MGRKPLRRSSPGRHPKGGPLSVERIEERLRKDPPMTAGHSQHPTYDSRTEATQQSRLRATVGAQAPIKHAEPPLTLDPDAIEPVAHEVITSHPDDVVSPFENSGVLRVDGVHKDVEDVILELLERVEKLELKTRSLQNSINRLGKGSTSTGGPDPLNEAIIDFMNALPAGVKLTTGSVAASINFEDADNTKVGNRLRTLVRHGIVKCEKPARGDLIFWMEREE